MSWLERAGAPGGAVAGTLAALCCAGAPGGLAFVSALGAGFLINDLFLLPLLAVSLGVAIWGLARGAKRRHDRRPLWLGVASSAGMVAGIFLGAWIVWLAAVALVGASIWNLLPTPSTEPGG